MKVHLAVPPLLRQGPTLALVIALSTCLPAQAQSRFTVSTSGLEVTDTRTGLTWRRCAEGQTFDGSTCSGNVLHLTHETALAYARDQAGWRLPNVKELQTLIDRSQTAPSIDTSAFPGTPLYWFWTSTPVVGNEAFAWVVFFRSGGGVYVNRRDSTTPDGSSLRLVRGGQ
jgi:hypothetical protein